MAAMAYFHKTGQDKTSLQNEQGCCKQSLSFDILFQVLLFDQALLDGFERKDLQKTGIKEHSNMTEVHFQWSQDMARRWNKMMKYHKIFKHIRTY